MIEFYKNFDCDWDKLGFLQGLKDEKCREMVRESFDKMIKYLSDKDEDKNEDFVYFPFIRRSIESNEMNRVIEPEEIDEFFKNTQIYEILEYHNESDEENQNKRVYENIYESKLINGLTLHEFNMFIHNKENKNVNLLMTLFRGIVDLEAVMVSISSAFFAYKNKLIK